MPQKKTKHKILTAKYQSQGYKPEQFVRSSHREYPVGHATGMNASEWRYFAENEYEIGRFDHLKSNTK